MINEIILYIFINCFNKNVYCTSCATPKKIVYKYFFNFSDEFQGRVYPSISCKIFTSYYYQGIHFVAHIVIQKNGQQYTHSNHFYNTIQHYICLLVGKSKYFFMSHLPLHFSSFAHSFY